MDIYNPYIAAGVSGLLVYFYRSSFNDKTTDNKQKKHTNLNYVFITSLFVFIIMNYFSNTTTVLEPTLTSKFEE